MDNHTTLCAKKHESFKCKHENKSQKTIVNQISNLSLKVLTKLEDLTRFLVEKLTARKWNGKLQLGMKYITMGSINDLYIQIVERGNYKKEVSRIAL